MTYRCWSVSMLPGSEREDVERGGKSGYPASVTMNRLFIYYSMFNVMISVIMPPSALDTLTRLNINYPMLFKLSNKRSNRQTHCGVLEFIADEEKIYIPYWVLINYFLIFIIRTGIKMLNKFQIYLLNLRVPLFLTTD